jgi:hypothetical protein
LLALRERTAFFLERLLKIANSFLETDGHLCHGWTDRSTELNLYLFLSISDSELDQPVLAKLREHWRFNRSLLIT